MVSPTAFPSKTVPPPPSPARLTPPPPSLARLTPHYPPQLAHPPPPSPTRQSPPLPSPARREPPAPRSLPAGHQDHLLGPPRGPASVPDSALTCSGVLRQGQPLRLRPSVCVGGWWGGLFLHLVHDSDCPARPGIWCPRVPSAWKRSPVGTAHQTSPEAEEPRLWQEQPRGSVEAARVFLQEVVPEAGRRQRAGGWQTRTGGRTSPQLLPGQWLSPRQGGQEKRRRPGPHSLEQRAWSGHSSAGRGTSGPVLSPLSRGEPRILRSGRAAAECSHGAHLIK